MERLICGILAYKRKVLWLLRLDISLVLDDFMRDEGGNMVGVMVFEVSRATYIKIHATAVERYSNVFPTP
jgi:hypothetical protein